MISELPENPRLIPYLRQFRQVYHKAENLLERKKAELFG
jgi:hypothetical protein